MLDISLVHSNAWTFLLVAYLVIISFHANASMKSMLFDHWQRLVIQNNKLGYLYRLLAVLWKHLSFHKTANER